MDEGSSSNITLVLLDGINVQSCSASVFLDLAGVIRGALLRPVFIDNMSLNGLIKHVHMRGRKLAGTDAALKEQIEFRKGATARLRHAEVGVNDAQKADAPPEEARIVAPVPLARVQHVRGQDAADDTNHVVKVATEHDRLDLQATSGELSHEGVANSSHGQLVEKGPRKHQRSGGHRRLITVGIRDQTEEAHDQEHGAQSTQAVQIEGATANAEGHQEPGSKDTHHVDTVLAHCKVIGIGRVQTGLLQKVGRVVREGVTTQVLNGPDHAHNFRAAQVRALEAVQVAGPLGNLRLQGGRVHHHRDRLIRIELGVFLLGGQAFQRPLGVLGAAPTNQPPGRFGGEHDSNEQRQGPHPLQAVGDPIGPFVVPGQHGSNDSDANQLAEPPAEIDIGGQIPSQGDRTDFRGVGDGQSLEHTPGDTTENLRREEGLNILGCEKDGRPCTDQDETGHDGVPISESLRGPPVDEETDDLTHGGTVAQSGLPLDHKKTRVSDVAGAYAHEISQTGHALRTLGTWKKLTLAGT